MTPDLDAPPRSVWMAPRPAATGRDPNGFKFVAQVGAGGDAAARADAREG
jgi:hypothetical protein